MTVGLTHTLYVQLFLNFICDAVPYHATVYCGEWRHVLSLYLWWGGFWEVLFLLADDTGRSSWSVSLARCPLRSPRHLSEDLIIHEHSKSFQLIKHLSFPRLEAWKIWLIIVIRVIRLLIIVLPEGILSILAGLEILTWLDDFSRLFGYNYFLEGIAPMQMFVYSPGCQ